MPFNGKFGGRIHSPPKSIQRGKSGERVGASSSLTRTLRALRVRCSVSREEGAWGWGVWICLKAVSPIRRYFRPIAISKAHRFSRSPANTFICVRQVRGWIE